MRIHATLCTLPLAAVDTRRPNCAPAQGANANRLEIAFLRNIPPRQDAFFHQLRFVGVASTEWRFRTSTWYAEVYSGSPKRLERSGKRSLSAGGDRSCVAVSADASAGCACDASRNGGLPELALFILGRSNALTSEPPIRARCGNSPHAGICARGGSSPRTKSRPYRDPKITFCAVCDVTPAAVAQIHELAHKDPF